MPIASFSSCCLFHLRGCCVVSCKQIWPAGATEPRLLSMVIHCVESVTEKNNCHHFKDSLTLWLCCLFCLGFYPGCSNEFISLYKNRLGKNIFILQKNSGSRQRSFTEPTIRSQSCGIYGYLPLSLHLTEFADRCDIFVIAEKNAAAVFIVAEPFAF